MGVESYQRQLPALPFSYEQGNGGVDKACGEAGSLFTYCPLDRPGYALEGALYGFATETALGALPNPNILMSENANCRSS